MRKHDKIRMYRTEMRYGYQKYESIQQTSTSKKRVCGYFVVSDLHKVTEADIHFRSEELLEEIEKHSDWMLESIIWDANHRIDTNREGLNIILDKAKNNEFDILLLHHVTLISRSGNKTFDYVLQLYKMDKTVYGIIDGIHSLKELTEALSLNGMRRKKCEMILPQK